MNHKTTTVAQARTAIKKIGADRKKLDDSIQAVALVCAYHAHVHGDTTLAAELVKATTGGCKSEALRLWLCEFGPIVAEQGNVLRYSKSKKLEGAELDANMDAAAEKQWHEYKTEKKAEDFDFASGVMQLLRKLDKAGDDAFALLSDEDKAVVAAMRAVKPKVKATKAAAKAGK